MAKAKQLKPYQYPGMLGQVGNPAALFPELEEAVLRFARANPGTMSVEEIWKQEAAKLIRRHLDAAMIALLKHYGLRTEDPPWELLALHMARNHVPAFQAGDPIRRGRPAKSRAPGKKTRGAPTKWTHGKYAALLPEFLQLTSTSRRAGSWLLSVWAETRC
jgi:hypothetical protein